LIADRNADASSITQAMMFRPSKLSFCECRDHALILRGNSMWSSLIWTSSRPAVDVLPLARLEHVEVVGEPLPPLERLELREEHALRLVGVVRDVHDVDVLARRELEVALRVAEVSST
jgi:hypothetical protein